MQENTQQMQHYIPQLEYQQIVQHAPQLTQVPLSPTIYAQSQLPTQSMQLPNPQLIYQTVQQL